MTTGIPQDLDVPPRTVAVVGNAPTGDAARIDAADWVVRFNNAPGFGAEAGGRVTHLALVNHGGQMREWLHDPAFIARPVVRAARAFLLPFARKAEQPQGEDGRDWTDAAVAMLAPLRAPVVAFDPEIGRQAARVLQAAGAASAAPSTGFLVMLHLLRTLAPAVRIEAFGFGFAGWNGHAWEAERGWFERMEAEGRLTLYPPGRGAT